jgi:hypothetical protein
MWMEVICRSKNLNAFKHARTAEYISQCGCKSHVDWKVHCIQQCKKFEIHLSIWMGVLSIQSLTAITNARNAKYIFQLGWKSYVDPKLCCIHKCKKCEIQLSMWMEVLCRFKSLKHSEMQELLNTFLKLDASPMSTQRSTAFNNARTSEYISQFGWKSYIDSKVDCINKCQTCKIHVSICMEVLWRCKTRLHSKLQELLDKSFDLDESPMSIQSLTALTNARTAEYISQCGWKYWIDSKVDCVQHCKKC